MVEALPGPREPKPVRIGSCAHTHPETLSARHQLDGLRVHTIALAARAIEADGGNMYATDFMISTMLQRTFGVLDALIDAVDAFNLHAAAPLLRLQLDTLFRAHYLATCEDSDKLSMDILSGKQFRKLKDAEGLNLTDARLKNLASSSYVWAPGVYDNTSGWVHLSASHMGATVRAGEGGTFEIRVPLPRETVPGRLWLEILEAACKATEEFFALVEGWEARKGLPPGQMRDLAARRRRALCASRGSRDFSMRSSAGQSPAGPVSAWSWLPRSRSKKRQCWRHYPSPDGAHIASAVMGGRT
jgi:hypothetical protein